MSSPRSSIASTRLSGPAFEASYHEESYSSGGAGGAQAASGHFSSSGHHSSSSHHSSSGSAARAAGSSSASSGSNGAVNQIASDLLLLNQGNSNNSNASRASHHSSHHSNAGESLHIATTGSASAHGSSHGSASAHFSSSGGGSAFSSHSASASASGSATFLSAIESAILRSNIPIEINETEEITVNGERGIWANRSEVVNWRGVIPITEYIINEDANPEIITKRTEQQLVYIQELAIRYLRPPTPPAPGEIYINQELNTLTPPAPPLVIRQQPARPDTPEPLVIREAPPEPPAAVGQKVITISGKRIPPPPRKVVIERLAPLPSKPQSVLVERWLPYSEVKRRVIFKRSAERDAVVIKPRNVIVQWEAPSVTIKKEFKYLGVIRANPAEYVQRYGATLKAANELPDFVLDIKTPEGIVLAADYRYNAVHELEGDVQALKFIDLDREGLSEYRSLLAKLGIHYVGAESLQSALAAFSGSSASFAASSSSASGHHEGGLSISAQADHLSQSQHGGSAHGGSVHGGSVHGGSAHGSHHSAHHSSHHSGHQSHHSHHSHHSAAHASGHESAAANNAASFSSHSAAGSSSSISSLIEQIFRSISKDNKISLVEAQTVLLRLNSRLGRKYGEDEVKAFYNVLDVNKDGSIDLEEFKRAFVNVSV